MARPISEDQRERFAEKIMDWGNLVFVGTAITQVFEGFPLTVVRVFMGTAALIGAYWFAYWLTQGGDD